MLPLFHISHLNIAIGTTDPGHWVYSLNYILTNIEFVFILAADVQVLDSIAYFRTPGIPGSNKNVRLWKYIKVIWSSL